MNDEKIKVRVTGSGQTLEVVVFSKRADRIEVVLGEGVHSVRCALTPTRNGLAYAGNALGREIVYERSREQVQADQHGPVAGVKDVVELVVGHRRLLGRRLARRGGGGHAAEFGARVRAVPLRPKNSLR